ncbi:hypothetical protein ATCC90586_004917 [Pythium insidiosum]|nr:hypothetical protein ATCC90586_004917 [Pythium insidiosum]
MAAPVKVEGAVPKKVYMHYEEGEEALHVTLKMTLPSKWAGHTVDYLKEFFVDHYNKKKPDNTVEAACFHLEKKAGVALFGDDLLHTAVEKYDDLFLKAGASKSRPPKPEVAKAPVAASNLQQCKNYGCRQKFDESDNHDSACRHHVKPPLFHDTKKGWQCCSSKMVYDWDDFEKIEPCAVGRHSTTDPGSLFAQSPTVALAESAGASSTSSSVPAPVLKSIDDYNKSNPDAVTAVSAAVETQAAPAPVRTDGKARCVNYGCQKEYVVADNHAQACSHHTGAPVFHDAGKYWSCCPKAVKYDFEAFLQVPGCATSAHRDTKAQ